MKVDPEIVNVAFHAADYVAQVTELGSASSQRASSFDVCTKLDGQLGPSTPVTPGKDPGLVEGRQT